MEIVIDKLHMDPKSKQELIYLHCYDNGVLVDTKSVPYMDDPIALKKAIEKKFEKIKQKLDEKTAKLQSIQNVVNLVNTKIKEK